MIISSPGIFHPNLESSLTCSTCKCFLQTVPNIDLYRCGKSRVSARTCRNVANNRLEGPIPDNLSSCTNLNSLWEPCLLKIKNYYIFKIKSWSFVFHCSNVHGNKLNGTVPLAFQRLESMTYLWVRPVAISFIYLSIHYMEMLHIPNFTL